MFVTYLPDVILEGKKAFWDGVSIKDNPYCEGKQRNYYESWLDGWLQGNEENGWYDFDFDPSTIPPKDPKTF